MYPFFPLDGILSVELAIALAFSALICIFAQERKGAGLAMTLLLFVPLTHLAFSTIESHLYLWLTDFDDEQFPSSVLAMNRVQYLGEIAVCLLIQPFMFLLILRRFGTKISTLAILWGLAGLGALFSVFAIAEGVAYAKFSSASAGIDEDILDWMVNVYPAMKLTTIFIGVAALFGAFCALTFSKQHPQSKRTGLNEN